MNEISGLNLKIKTELLRLGADIVGFGSLLELPVNIRRGLPNGICVAVKYPREIIRGIGELPTEDYRVWYDKLNERLDMIVTKGAEFLIEQGFNAAIVIVLYADGQVIGVDFIKDITVPGNSNNNNFTKTYTGTGADMIKVMLWDGLNTMQPLCEPEIILTLP